MARCFSYTTLINVKVYRVLEIIVSNYIKPVFDLVSINIFFTHRTIDVWNKLDKIIKYDSFAEGFNKRNNILNILLRTSFDVA